jgi:LysM repeat protein
MENNQKKNRARPLMVLFSLVMALTLLVSALPQASAGAQTCKFRHTVQQGETLSYLADLYQVTVEEIAKANNLQPPYVIVAGTVLCIPGGVKPGAGTATPTGKQEKAAPTLTIFPGLNAVFVSVENFLPKTSYYVRLHPYGTSASYRIGNFTTNKEGDFADWFRLPPDVPRTFQMQVCVKNVWTDAVSCAKYDDAYPWLDALVRIRCQKEGR